MISQGDDTQRIWKHLTGCVVQTIPDMGSTKAYALVAIAGSHVSWGASWGEAGLEGAVAMRDALADIQSISRPATCVGSGDATATIRKSFDHLDVKGFVLAVASADGEVTLAGDGRRCSVEDWGRIGGFLSMITRDLGRWIKGEQKVRAERIGDIFDLAEKVYLEDRETPPRSAMEMAEKCGRRLYKFSPNGLGISPLNAEGRPETEPAAPVLGIQINGIVEGTDIEAARTLMFPFSMGEYRRTCDALAAELDDAAAEWDAQGNGAPVAMAMRP